MMTCRPLCINGELRKHDLSTSEHDRWMKMLQASMKFIRGSMPGVRSWYFGAFCWENWDYWRDIDPKIGYTNKTVSLLSCSSGA
jgi:hypothetical protein